MKNASNVIVTVGLVLGGVLGIAGSIVTQPNVRATCWGVDAVGVIVATTLLALKFFRAGDDWLTAGFVIYTLGEAIMLTGTASTLEASAPAFAAGTALWSAGLLLVSIPRTFPIWARATGVIAAVLFAITAGKIFWGQPVVPITAPLPMYAYPFLVLTFIGWIWNAQRSS